MMCYFFNIYYYILHIIVMLFLRNGVDMKCQKDVY